MSKDFWPSFLFAFGYKKTCFDSAPMRVKKKDMLIKE